MRPPAGSKGSRRSYALWSAAAAAWKPAVATGRRRRPLEDAPATICRWEGCSSCRARCRSSSCRSACCRRCSSRCSRAPRCWCAGLLGGAHPCPGRAADLGAHCCRPHLPLTLVAWRVCGGAGAGPAARAAHRRAHLSAHAAHVEDLHAARAQAPRPRHRRRDRATLRARGDRERARALGRLRGRLAGVRTTLPPPPLASPRQAR